MPTPISKQLDRQFASTPLEPTQCPRFTVTLTSEFGIHSHDFCDLDCAVDKISELMVLGIEDVHISRTMSDYKDSRNPNDAT